MEIYKSDLPREQKNRIYSAMRYLAEVKPTEYSIEYSGPCITLYRLDRAYECYDWMKIVVLYYY